MSKTLQLHGLYNYREAITADKPDAFADGAIAVNPKFKEVVIKYAGDWYYIEGDAEKSEAERELHASILKLHEEHGDNVVDVIKDITVTYALKDKDGVDCDMVIINSTIGGRVPPEEPKVVDLTLYDNVKDYGVF